MQQALKHILGFIPALIAWIFALVFLAPFAITKSEYFRRIALSFDQLANAFMNGDEDETPSSRMGRALKDGNLGCCKWRYYLCKVLSWADPTTEKHCEQAIGE